MQTDNHIPTMPLNLSNPAAPKTATAHGALFLLLVALGVLFILDFSRERERTVAEASRIAMHKSQLIGALFSDTFVAADYVLRDITGHAEHRLSGKPGLATLEPMLEKKLASVPGLTDLVVLDQDCRFAAVAKNKNLAGTTSRQRICTAGPLDPGESLHIQYMPPEKSANGQPVVLMSCVISSPEGKLQAAAMAVMELSYAQSWIESFAVNPFDVQTIIDSEGIVIARHPMLPGGLGAKTSAPAGQPAFDQMRGTTSFSAQSPLDGRQRIYGVSALEKFPFVAIVGFDEARALEAWRMRAWHFGIGYAVLAVLAWAQLRAYLHSMRQQQDLRKLATTDSLTGIPNRRQLFASGEQEMRRARRYGTPLAVLMIDIDHFKKVNDRWGHPAGDRVIRDLAGIMQGMLRSVDICGRLGGEEFTVIMPETDVDGARIIAERLRLAMEASENVHHEAGEVIRYTVSVGIAIRIPEDANFSDVLRRADQALYEAKNSGRNRIAVQ